MTGVMEYERDLQHRRWTAAELEATTELVLPPELALLPRGVLADGPPAVVEMLPG